MVGTFSNIDARKQQEEANPAHGRMKTRSTKLPNRVLLDDRMRQAIRRRGAMRDKVGLIFFDLDKFKPVNDNYGHAVGDILLQQSPPACAASCAPRTRWRASAATNSSVLLPRVAGTGDRAKSPTPSCAS